MRIDLQYMRLLIVDNNVALTWRLQRYLGVEFELRTARTGEEAWQYAETGIFDAIILELELPDTDGDTVCRTLRRAGITTPIMILTACNDLTSKVRLLENGADDYMTKPFEPTELRVRIHSLLRRRQLQPLPHTLHIGDLIIDPIRRTVTRKGVHIMLRRKEFDILEYLAHNPGKVITHETILDHVWAEARQGTLGGTVRVHIKNLRDKIDRPFATQLIRSVRGIGYILDTSSKSRNEVEK